MSCLYCGKTKIMARGMCGRHYKLWYKGKPLTNPSRYICPIDVKHPVYVSWVNMKTRCNNPNATQWYWYGGRGIRYTKRWEEFQNFYEDMFSDWLPGLVLDRRDNDENYFKENCRWVTTQVSAENRRKRGTA